jgi:hypothetical protein
MEEVIRPAGIFAVSTVTRTIRARNYSRVENQDIIISYMIY